MRLTEAEGLSAGGGLGGLLGGTGDRGGILADGEGRVLRGCHSVGAIGVFMWSQTVQGRSNFMLDCAVVGFSLSLIVVAYLDSTEEFTGMVYGGGRAWSFGFDAPRHSAQGSYLGLRRQYNSSRPQALHGGLDF